MSGSSRAERSVAGLRLPSPAEPWPLAVLLSVGLLLLLPAVGGPVPAATPRAFWIAVLHVVLLSLVLALRLGPLAFAAAAELPAEPVARRVWRQYQRGLNALCLAWWGLYVWLAVTWGRAVFGGASGSAWLDGPRALAVGEVLNTLASLAFLYLFLVLDHPSVPVAGEEGRDEGFKRSWRLACTAAGAVAALSVLDRLGYLVPDLRLGPLAGSFFAAVAMMYFFGRFDFRYMRVPRLQIAPLYVYVALQVAWERVSSRPDGLADAAFGLALGLKVYLLYLQLRWMRNRTLQRYFDFAAL